MEKNVHQRVQLVKEVAFTCTLIKCMYFTALKMPLSIELDPFLPFSLLHVYTYTHYVWEGGSSPLYIIG